MICGCNSPFGHHKPGAKKNLAVYDSNTAKKWDFKNDTEDDGCTDAYGDIVFLGHNEVTPTKYIKVSAKTDADQLIKFLTSKTYWNLKRPKMLISVSGGTRIDVSPELKTKFCQGLYRAAKTTGFLTNNTEIMCF